MSRLRRSWTTLAVVLVLVVVIAVQARNQASYVSEGLARIGEAAGPVAAVQELTSVDQLKARFAAGQGHPRLILLFSPT